MIWNKLVSFWSTSNELTKYILSVTIVTIYNTIWESKQVNVSTVSRYVYFTWVFSSYYCFNFNSTLKNIHFFDRTLFFLNLFCPLIISQPPCLCCYVVFMYNNTSVTGRAPLLLIAPTLITSCCNNFKCKTCNRVFYLFITRIFSRSVQQ